MRGTWEPVEWFPRITGNTWERLEIRDLANVVVTHRQGLVATHRGVRLNNLISCLLARLGCRERARAKIAEGLTTTASERIVRIESSTAVWPESCSDLGPIIEHWRTGPTPLRLLL